MKRAFLLLLVILASTAFSCKREAPSGATGPMTIGAVLPLSGDAAGYGKSVQQGIELALTTVKRDAFRLQYEDSQGDPAKSIAALRKLVDINHAHVVIGPFSSSEAFAMLPVANRAGVVLISPGASAPGLSRPGDSFFRIVASDAYDGIVLARFAREQLKATTASILYNNSEYGVGVHDAFEHRFVPEGGRIVSSDGYSATDTDVRTLLNKIKSAHPDVLVLVGYKEMGNIVKQAKEQHLDIPILSEGLFEDPDVLRAAGDAANGVWYSFTSFDPTAKDLAVVDFVRRYHARYGKQPDILAALGYDSLRLVGDVTQNGAVTDAKAIMARLYSVKNFAGASGEMTFDANGDVSKPFGIKRIVNGKPEWYRRTF